jgi:O-antigen/teichoic acid export membrane protein
MDFVESAVGCDFAQDNQLKPVMSMNRGKLFVENFIIFGLGSVISRVIPYLMLPLIAVIFPDASYMGIYDTLTVFVVFGASIAVMGIYDVMFRLFFEKAELDYQTGVTSTSLFIVTLSSLLFFGLVVLFRSWLAALFFESKSYSWLVALSGITIIFSALNIILSAPTRMQNKRGIYIFINTLAPIVSYGISIPLLFSGAYVLALPLAALITAFLTCFVYLLLNRSYFRCCQIKMDLAVSMLKIAVPIVPCFIFYWVFSSIDRIMITNIIGLSQTGVYAFAANLARISMLVYIAFAGGYQYFAYSTMKDRDHTELISRVFDYLCGLSCLALCAVIPLSKFIFTCFFPDAYYQGWAVFPMLFAGPLFLMLFQTISNQFLVVKKSWPPTIILAFGASLTIALDFLLIQPIGIQGAAIGAFSGYVFSVAMAAIILVRMELIRIPLRPALSAVLAVVGLLMHMAELPAYFVYSFCGISLLVIVLLYVKDALDVLKRFSGTNWLDAERKG